MAVITHFMVMLYLMIMSYAAAIKIGVIVNINTNTGREQKIATEIAARHFNSSSSVLLLNYSETASNEPHQVALDGKKLVNEWGAEAIIAAGTWPQLTSLMNELIGTRANVPVLLLEALPPSTSTPQPYVFLMSSGATKSRIRCVAELVQSYKWRRTIVIYEDDDHSNVSGTLNLLLSDALRDVGSGIEDRVAFYSLDKLNDSKLVIRQELERVRLQLCKVFIILHFSKSSAVNLFKEAHALGMMNKGHVWIIADDSITNLFEYYSSDLSDYAEGVLGIKDYFNKTTKSYQEFHAEFQRIYKSNYGAEVDPGRSSLLAYDAVNMLTLAENKGKTLLEGIRSSDFDGLTGYIRSGESGNLATKESSSAFQIINVVGKSYRDLGIWYAEDGFYEGDEKVDSFGPVFWPGGPRGAPGGWGKLKIGVPARTTFDQFIEVKYDHKGKVKLITGYCIDVFRETLKRLKYNLTYEFFPFHGTYDDLIDQVTIKNYDAVVGDITILAKRSEKVDFTQPYVGSGLAILARVKPDHRTFVFLKPFTCAVWMCTILGFLYTAAIVWFLERKENSESAGSWSNQIEATILLIFTIFCNFKKIRSYYTLVVIMVWLFAAFIITQSYTASLSSILTTQELEPVVSFRKIGCDGDSFVVKYLQEVLGYPPRKIYKIGTEKNYPEAFESGKISVAFMETPYLRVFLSRHEEYTVHGETHRLGGFGFVFPKGSPLAVDLSEAILELSEEGVLKDLENKWFSFSFSNYPSTKKIGNENSLSLGHLWGLFVLTGATTTFIFVLFLIRLPMRNSQRQEDEDNGSVSEKELQSPSMHYSSSMEGNSDGLIEDGTNQNFHTEQTYQGSPKSQVLQHEGNDSEEFE